MSSIALGPLVVAAGKFHATVGKIYPEPDEYETDKGKIIVDSEFWKQGADRAVDVKAFKRFACTLKINDGQATDVCQVLISARGNIVTVTRPKKLAIRAREIMNALKLVSDKFDYNTAAQRYYPHENRGTPRGIAPLDPLDNPDVEYAVAGDAYWLADVLHHVRDAGGFNGEGKIGKP